MVEMANDVNDWKDPYWQEKTYGKPMRFWIRDEIEEIIKEENIDRSRFYEYSKIKYYDIIKKFYYTFCDYRNFVIDKIRLEYHNLHIRKNLENHIIAGFFQSDGWEDYLNKIRSEIVTDSKLFLILSERWVYEGYPDEIITVLSETDGWLQDFYIVSPKFEWFIVHDYIEDCAEIYRKGNTNESNYKTS